MYVHMLFFKWQSTSQKKHSDKDYKRQDWKTIYTQQIRKNGNGSSFHWFWAGILLILLTESSWKYLQKNICGSVAMFFSGKIFRLVQSERI